MVTANDVGICQHFWPKFLKPCWQPKFFPMVPMLAPKNFLPFCLGHVNDVGICQHFSPKFLKPCWQPKNFPSWRPKFFPHYLVHVNDVGLCQHFWPKFLKPCWQPKKFPCWRPNVVICWHVPTFSRISINHVGSWKSWQFPPPLFGRKVTIYHIFRNQGLEVGWNWPKWGTLRGHRARNMP